MAFGINIPVAFKLNPAGLKHAKKEFGDLGEHIKKGLEFAGIATGIGEILNVAKESIGLAAQDIKSRKLLDLQIKTSTHSTLKQVAANEKYLDSLSMQVGVTKNELRPALANAVRGTGSLSKAQNILKIALDGAAATGKPLGTVMQALIKASNGQTTALYRLAPQLKATKGGLQDFAASVKDAAATSANPFDKFKVAMEELQIKLGTALLPSMQKVSDYLIKNVIPKVSKFLDDVSNPKTDAGKSFYQIKAAVKATFNGVKDFFALFGNGDAMKGFGNVTKSLVQALPALLALKGIMVLASAGRTIANLVAAMTAIRGGTTTPGVGPVGANPLGGAGGKSPLTFMESWGKAFTPVAVRGLTALEAFAAGSMVGLGGGVKIITPRDQKRMEQEALKAYPGNAAQIRKMFGDTTIVVNSYGSTPAQFNSLVKKALDEHNRLNGKK